MCVPENSKLFSVLPLYIILDFFLMDFVFQNRAAEKIGKTVRKFPYTLHPASPVNILHSMVHLLQLRSQYFNKATFSIKILKFLPNVFFLVQDATLLLVVRSPWVPLGCDGFSDLFLMTILRSSVNIFYRMFLLWNLSCVFIMT